MIVDYRGFEIEVGSATYDRLVGQGLLVPVPGASEGLSDLNVAELRERAAEVGVEGASSMKKAELIDAIESAQAGETLSE